MTDYDYTESTEDNPLILNAKAHIYGHVLTAEDIKFGGVGILGAAHPDNPKWVGPFSFVPDPLEGDHYSVERHTQLIPGCICGQCEHLYEDVPGGLWCVRYKDVEYDDFRERRTRDLFAYHEADISGYVYILEAGPYYKIGRTKNPDERIKALTIQLPFPVKVIDIIACDNEMEAEKAFHEWHAHRRTNGEWFELSYGEAHSFGSCWINGEMLY